MIVIKTANSIYKIDKDSRKILTPTKGWVGYDFLRDLEVGKSLFIAVNGFQWMKTSPIQTIFDEDQEPEMCWAIDVAV